MSAQIIEGIDNTPNQQFGVSLSVDSNILKLILGLRYNDVAGYWLLRIMDENSNLLVDNVPLLTGSWPAANILQQYRYLRIGSAFVINVSGIAKNYPDDSDLGTDFILLWDDTPLG